MGNKESSSNSTCNTTTKDMNEHMNELSLNSYSIAIKNDMFNKPTKNNQLDRLKGKLMSRDYRAFMFVVHAKYGILLLYCTRKPKKGPHYQLPGGHVDMDDLMEVLQSLGDNMIDDRAVFVKACAIAACRELYEETGIDVRTELHRIQPKQLRPKGNDDSITDQLACELKNRLFFSLHIHDEDFPNGGTYAGHDTDLGQNDKVDEDYSYIRLKLSIEHSGFIFERETDKVIKLLLKHSGGKCSQAFRTSIENHNEILLEEEPSYFSLLHEKLK